jgi:hypothetical protein
MYPARRPLSGAIAFLIWAGAACAAEPPMVSFEKKPGQVEIQVGGKPLATYVHEDAKITRPYFAHVKAPGGIQVTRNHPPIPGKDLTDHDTFHPGIWLAFGDVNGHDYWRLKAKVRHHKFIDEPSGGPGKGSFAVENHYLSTDGKAVVCRETARYTFLVRPSGYLMLFDSEFRSDKGDLVFGDQEEMGLGVRVATPLSVLRGGQIVTSSTARNEKEVRGRTDPWADYSAVIDRQHVGVTLMPDPKNFRPSWYHARDYGLLAANPFGRNALTGGQPSKVVMKQGEPFRLRFGVLIHAQAENVKPFDLSGAYEDYLKQMAKE